MNRNPKEKLARIELRARPADKQKIQRLAAKCHLTVSEYMVKRALGYEPRVVLPDVFYDLYGKLCKLENEEPSEEIDEKLLEIIEEIHEKLLLPGRDGV